MTGEFPTQRVNNAENVSIWWRHQSWLSSGCHFHCILCFRSVDECAIMTPLPGCYGGADRQLVRWWRCPHSNSVCRLRHGGSKDLVMWTLGNKWWNTFFVLMSISRCNTTSFREIPIRNITYIHGNVIMDVAGTPAKSQWGSYWFLHKGPVMQSFDVFFWCAPVSTEGGFAGDSRRHDAHMTSL